MKVGGFSCESHFDAKNMLKAFKMKYRLEIYEVLSPIFDPNGYARDVLQIGSVIKHVTTIEDYWANCKDEFQSHDHAFSRVIVDQVKMYKINLDVEGIEDDGKNMYSNTYLTKLRYNPMSSESYQDVGDDLEVMMDQIIKRTRKWVQ